MAFNALIFDVLRPFGCEKENTAKIYQALADVFDVVESDVMYVFQSFFPYLSSSEVLERHRAALNVLKFPLDTEENLRMRVANAFNFLQRIGEKKLLDEYLSANFAGRYEYVELPKGSWRMGFAQLGVSTHLYSIAGFRIYVDDITDDEYDALYSFLDSFLDADIEFYIHERTMWGVMPGWKMGFGQLGVNTYFCHD